MTVNTQTESKDRYLNVMVNDEKHGAFGKVDVEVVGCHLSCLGTQMPIKDARYGRHCTDRIIC